MHLPYTMKGVFALPLAAMLYGATATPLYKDQFHRGPAPTPHLMALRQVAAEGESAQPSMTTMTRDGVVGVFKATQNPAFATLQGPLATNTVMSLTVDGKPTSTSLPLIAGPGGWVWEPQLRTPENVYPSWPVETPPPR